MHTKRVLQAKNENFNYKQFVALTKHFYLFFFLLKILLYYYFCLFSQLISHRYSAISKLQATTFCIAKLVMYIISIIHDLNEMYVKYTEYL